MRIVGLFAHPDDEVFCAGGSFARYAASGADVVIVSATTG
ncbi:MAG: GlcNAc-PI de-N-acetylase [Acidimicrobiaceae bacterium]|jgi:LmbE family N-acetylglucosaminyl deacetylase|nr:GlcNAc-PI de-N-acetylase [Acidimicrobiaceae bacterium]